KPPRDWGAEREAFIESTRLFEGRVRNVEAAHHYLEGGGPYTLAGGLGRGGMLAISLGLPAALLAITSTGRSRWLMKSHRWRFGWRWRAGATVDNWLSVRWPVLWNSRIHRSLVVFALPVVTLIWSNSSQVASVWVAILVYV